MGRKDSTVPPAASALETAAKYLSSRMRTAAELRDHLLRKGYSADETEDAVSEMIGYRYIDDYQYAMRYYEYNREKHRGSMRAARELAEKGVDADTIKFAREDFLYNEKIDEYTLGQFLYFLMMTCAVTGKLMGVDPFNQPGVEDYKQEIRNLLGQ